MTDLTQLSDSDIKALYNNDYQALSNEGLQVLYGQGDVQSPETQQEKEPEKEQSWLDLLDTAARQYTQGASFGFADEVMDPALSFIVSKASGVPYEDVLSDARRMTKEDIEQDWEENPYLSAGANIAGGVITGGGALNTARAVAPTTTGKLLNVASQAPKRAALATGAGGGGLYSAGEAEGSLSERADDFGTGAMWGGPFGIAGYNVAKGIGRVGSGAIDKYGPRVAPYIERAKNYIPEAKTPKRQQAGILDDVMPDDELQEMTPARMAGILDEEDVARFQDTQRTIPLTRGDVSQNVGVQRAEQIAAESGSQPILSARAKQHEAARKPFTNVLGQEVSMEDIDLRDIEQEQMRGAADIVRGEYDNLSRRVQEAYSRADDAGKGVMISGDAVQKDLVGGINSLLDDEAYRIGDIPTLDRRVSDLKEIIGDVGEEEVKEITPARIKDLEAWKKRLNASIRDLPQDKKDTMRKMKLVGRQYDNFMTNLADDALINGDDSAIKAFKEARGLAKKKFDFYESDKAIQRILDQRDMSGENLVNVVLGAEKLKGKGDNGLLVSKMLEYAGPRALEMQQAMKKGIMAKALRRGLVRNTADPSDTAKNLVSFSKMRNEVGDILSKKEMLDVIFDETEQKYLRQFYDDLKFVASKQKGAINNSSTGVWTAEFAKGLGKVFNNPIMRSNPATGVPGQFLDSQFQRYATQQITGKAEKGLDEFIESAINQIDGGAVYYGSIGANAVGPDNLWDVITYDDEENE